MDINCPSCKENLNKNNSMKRGFTLVDTVWIGIRDGELKNCTTFESIGNYGNIRCAHCFDDIHEYISDLIKSNILSAGDFCDLKS